MHKSFLIPLLFIYSKGLSQDSFDMNLGLGIAKTSFYDTYNSNSGPHGSVVYPKYNHNYESTGISPFFKLSFNPIEYKALQLRITMLGGVYNEGLTYYSVDKLYNSTPYIRTVITANGNLQTPHIQFGLSPVIKIKQFKLILGIFNLESVLPPVRSTKFKGQRISYQVTPYAHSSGGYPSVHLDSNVTQSQLVDTSFYVKMARRNESAKHIFFPLSIGLEYQLRVKKHVLIIGTRIMIAGLLLSENKHQSFNFYIGYQFRRRQDVESGKK
jgi:hypothetical protein